MASPSADGIKLQHHACKPPRVRGKGDDDEEALLFNDARGSPLTVRGGKTWRSGSSILTAAATTALLIVVLHGLLAQNFALRSSHHKYVTTGLPSHGPCSCQDNKVAVIITVHGALAYLAGCLSTLAQHTTGVHLFLADDSANVTESSTVKAMLKTLPFPSTHLVMGATPQGYTKTVNAGLKAAHEQGFKYMVCLNSDTELTPNWLEALLYVLDSDKSIGMAGPTGNAASFQSVPELTVPSGDWSTNPLPPGWTPNMMAHLAFLTSDGRHVPVPILNGFLMVIRREVFDKIGFMDAEMFPYGFGEENDFALRAGQAGFKRVVVPWVYVYHHKTKSYTNEERRALVAKTSERLEGKYKQVLNTAVAELRDNRALMEMRNRIQLSLQNSLPCMQADFSVLFVLNIMPVIPPNQFMLHGGWISLVQEALGLARNGAHVRIAVQMWTLSYFAAAFPAANLRGVFWGFNGGNPDQVAEEILATGVVYDYIVATHYSTVDIVLKVSDVYPNIIPGYYVQDIETRFAGDTAEVVASRNSYINMHHGFVFVKTQWLQQQLSHLFGVTAHLIPPTVDSNLFKVDPAKQGPSSPLHFCAMVRVETPRRNPLQTLQIMSTIASRYGASKVQTSVFGSTMQVVADFLREQRQSPAILQQINLLGVLGRKEVASLSRKCDVFVDYSAWQAFGRSGLEAMASGCVPILPVHGGASEYAQNGINSFLIDTTNINNALKVVDDIVNNKYDLAAMRTAAILTAQKYTIEKSSAATADVFREFKKSWEVQKRLHT